MSYLKRRRRRRIAIGVFGVMVLGAMAWADRQGYLLYAGDDMWRYHGKAFEVLRVIDGDTLEIDVADPKATGFAGEKVGGKGSAREIGGGERSGGKRSGGERSEGERSEGERSEGERGGVGGGTRVRLWGVDTPETEKALYGIEGEAMAEEATAFTRQWVEKGGGTVVLELESHRTRGRFGRVVAHVRLSDGSVLNERLLAAGMAEADGRFEHQRIGRYALLAKQAEFERVGLWAEDEE